MSLRIHHDHSFADQTSRAALETETMEPSNDETSSGITTASSASLVLIERDSAGRPTGYACSHAVMKDDWVEFYRRRVQISQYYELLYDCNMESKNVEGTVESIASMLLQDIAASWDLIPSGLPCLEPAEGNNALQGVSTGENSANKSLMHQVGCQLLPQSLHDDEELLSSSSSSSSKTSTTASSPQCCQIVRLDLNLLPSLTSSDELQQSIQTFIEQELNTHIPTSVLPVRTLAIPDPFANRSNLHTTTAAEEQEADQTKDTNRTGESTGLGHFGWTMLGGTSLAVLMAGTLCLLILAYRRSRRLKAHQQHTRMMDHPHGWDKEMEDEEGDSTLAPDSSDSSRGPCGLYREGPLPAVANQHRREPSLPPPRTTTNYHCPQALAPSCYMLDLGESLRDNSFWQRRNCVGGWEVDEVSEADSWAQTDATVGSLEERLEQITVEI